MTVVVTGCAGFIGSQIVEACLERGDEVIGVDVMTDYYDVDQKRSNLRAALTPSVRVREIDLNDLAFDVLEWSRRHLPPGGPTRGAGVVA